MLFSLIRRSNERLQLTSTDRLMNDHPCRARMFPFRIQTFFVVLKGKNHADKPDSITAFVNDRRSTRARRPICAYIEHERRGTAVLLLWQFRQPVHHAGREVAPLSHRIAEAKDAVTRPSILVEWQRACISRCFDP